MNSQKLKFKKQLLASLLVTGLTIVASTSANALQYAFTDLTPSLPNIDPASDINSVANDINDFGQIVGYTSQWGIGTFATLWSNGVATQLDSSSSNSYSIANGINNAGQVVGSKSTYYLDQNNNTVTTTNPMLWSNGLSTELSKLDGYNNGSADAISEDGAQIIGGSFNYNNLGLRGRATLWNNGSISDITDITDYSGIDQSLLRGKNRSADFFLSSDSSGNETLISKHDYSVIDLKSLIDSSVFDAGWVLQAASINSQNYIVGFANNTFTNVQHAFLLTPVPEPDSYAMALIGLGLFGFMSRRRKAD